MIAMGEYNLGILDALTGRLRDRRERCSRRRSGHSASRATNGLLPFVLEDIAVLAVLEGDAETALRLAGAGAALRDETGAPRGPADQDELDAALAPAHEQLGEHASARLGTGPFR